MDSDANANAEKRARRRHWKSTRGHDQAHSGSESPPACQWTPFRAAEKYYKSVYPRPDLSSVLDPRALASACGHGHAPSIYTSPATPGLVVLPAFLSPHEQRDLVRCALRDHARPPNISNLDAHYALPPAGLWAAHLSDDPIVQPLAAAPPSELGPAQRYEEPSPVGPRVLVDNTPSSPATFDALASTPKLPPPPSTTVPPLPASHLLRHKLRWSNIGWYYHWGSKHYDFTSPKQDVHPLIRDLCKRAVRTVDWQSIFASAGDDSAWGEGGPDWPTWPESYEPDAGIVNFYQLRDTLMAHVDRSEVCATSPLVSISLGHSAIFLIGGYTRDTAPTPFLLRSGDVLIMAGPQCRRAYHGVPRILEGSLPPHFLPQSEGEDDDDDWAPFAKYMSTTRININVRQVFPKGFDPAAPG